ncbi:hypothetical protein [Embleya hyalina]|uniref:Uncharacterized protein n=1 Tax=Embleya hyalina TaxID=516124 RepID=A0A401Z1W3_9ACTN|nr:hypothetical protein [Embleya hyalina]GCE00822.1 hypothetical protein EHYA_08548 [Embleya hyalina]
MCGPTGADLRRELRAATGGAGLAVTPDAVGGSGSGALHDGLLPGRPLPTEPRTRRPDVRIVLFRMRERIHAGPRRERDHACEAGFSLIPDSNAATTVATIRSLSQVRHALEHDAMHERSGKLRLSKILPRMNTDRARHGGTTPDPATAKPRTSPGDAARAVFSSCGR